MLMTTYSEVYVSRHSPSTLKESIILGLCFSWTGTCFLVVLILGLYSSDAPSEEMKDDILPFLWSFMVLSYVSAMATWGIAKRMAPRPRTYYSY
jgi:hypothetical protein